MSKKKKKKLKKKIEKKIKKKDLENFSDYTPTLLGNQYSEEQNPADI